VPYALPAVCLDISSAEAQLGQVHATRRRPNIVIGIIHVIINVSLKLRMLDVNYGTQDNIVSNKCINILLYHEYLVYIGFYATSKLIQNLTPSCCPVLEVVVWECIVRDHSAVCKLHLLR